MRSLGSFVSMIFVFAFFLTGCSTIGTTAASDPVQNTVSLQGVAHGGQGPIWGATVQLYAAATSGYGAASHALITSPPTTNQFGQFTLTGQYTCTPGDQIYLLVTGGASDGNPQDTNSAIGLMSMLGTCPSTLNPNSNFNDPTSSNYIPFLYVNEVTTAAAAYAMAGYAVDATHVASDLNQTSTNSHPLAGTGIANAFANFRNLADVSTGTACTKTLAAAGTSCISSPNANGAAPSLNLYTLANILASCINTSSPSSTACSTYLFNDATNTGVPANSGSNPGTSPTETATAAINIAHHPGANVADLYTNLGGNAGAPYVGLASQPNDFTLPLTFSGNFNGPEGIAIDGSGNAWVVNNNGWSVTKLSSLGSFVGTYTPSGSGFYYPQGIAIDASNNAWITNSAAFNSAVIELNSNGGLVGNYTSFDGLDQPIGIAIDASGNAWTANSGNNDVSEFTTGTGVVNTYTLNYDTETPEYIAIDGSGYLWVSSNGNSVAVKFNSGGGVIGNYFEGGYNSPLSIAIDASGNAWLANIGGNNVTSIANGTPTTYAPSGSNFSLPEGIAIDGASNVWVTNYGQPNSGSSTRGTTITELTSTGGLAGNYGSSSAFDDPYGIAIDASGNTWVTNSANNSVTEIVGSATPVATPMAANLIAPYAVNASAINKP